MVKKIGKKFSALFLLLPPKVTLVIFLVLSVLLGYQFKHLQFKYDIESFFSKDENAENLAFYNSFKSSFENENNYLLIGVSNPNPTIFEASFLTKIDSFSNVLSELDGITNILTPTQISEKIKVPIVGLLDRPLLHISDSTQFESDKANIVSHSFYKSLFSPDFSSLLIVLKTKEHFTPQERSELITNIQSKASHFFDEFHLAGRLNTQEYYVSQMKRELLVFGSIAFIGFLLLFILFYRNFTYTFISVSSILLNIVFSFGVFALTGHQLSLMIILIPVILIVISTAISVHFISAFNEAVRNSTQNPLTSALDKTALPLLFNVITTSTGFASMVFIPIAPLREFSIFAALSILGSLFITLALCVSILSLKKVNQTSKLKLPSFPKLNFKPKKSFVISSFLLLLLIFFSAKNKIDNHFIDDVKSSAKIAQDLSFFEINFGGIRPFELVVSPKSDSSFLTLTTLKEVAQLENYLTSEYKVNMLLSPLTVIKSYHKSTHGGNTDFFTLPKTEKKLKKVIQQLQKRKLFNKHFSVLDLKNNKFRISGRIKDLGNSAILIKDKKLLEFSKNLSKIDVKLTGVAELIDEVNRGLSKNLLFGIFIAIIVSCLCVFLLTGSLKLALISIIPNVFPLFFASALLFLLGASIKIGTVMIFTIVYGLAVDDTMHFLFHYSEFNNKNYSTEVAIQKTINTVKQPMIFSTIVLAGGFVVFSFSSFVSIELLGILVSTSLGIALLADFVVLPQILQALFRNEAHIETKFNLPPKNTQKSKKELYLLKH